MRLAIVHNPYFQAKIEKNHRFPMPKYGRVAEMLVEDGLAEEGSFHSPGPAPVGWVGLAHDRRYVDQVFEAKVADDVERLIGFSVNESVAMRSRHACAGTVMTARLALEEGLAVSTAGGSHHAKRAHGAGFCVFNDVGVAASLLLEGGEADSVLVFDCDVHQGDGTAEIFRDEPRVRTVSIHAEKNFPTRKEQSDLDVALPDGVRDQAYLEVVEDTLERAFNMIRPDIVFYNAGVDPHQDDRLGRLSLTDAGLAERDRRVIGFFRDKQVPLAGVMGGGYSSDVEEIARRHTILHRVAGEFV